MIVNQANPSRMIIPSSAQAQLEVLKNVVKVLYDDKISYEVVKYIINLNGQPAEEEKMVNDLNLKFDNVRQCLTRMGNDGLLVSREYKRKKEEREEEDYSQQNQYTKRPMNKRVNTLEWKINDTFYNIIKQRFEDLKFKLNKTLEYKSRDKFECQKCKKVYELDQVAHIGYVCKECEDRPKLLEIKSEDVSMLRVLCNDLIQMLSEEFNRADKLGSGFIYNIKPTIRQSSVREKKTVNKLNIPNNKDNKDSENVGPNSELIIPNEIEDPEVEEMLEKIKKDEKKLKKLKEIMEIQMYK
jgi:hypothetical protein